MDGLNRRGEYYFAGNPEYAKESAKSGGRPYLLIEKNTSLTLDPGGYTQLEIRAGKEKVYILSESELAAKKEETPIQETINENYGKCEVPVGYAVMREKQAVADYKKRLLEELDMLFEANVVLDDPHTKVLMDRQASHMKRIVEEAE